MLVVTALRIQTYSSDSTGASSAAYSPVSAPTLLVCRSPGPLITPMLTTCQLRGVSGEEYLGTLEACEHYVSDRLYPYSLLGKGICAWTLVALGHRGSGDSNQGTVYAGPSPKRIKPASAKTGTENLTTYGDVTSMPYTI